MEFKKLMKEKIARAKESRIAKFIISATPKKNGVYILALVNVVCTTLLGAVITYPLYKLLGIRGALPTTLLTAAVVVVILASLVNRWLDTGFGRKALKGLLPLAIFFSLPFGVLSLPLLRRIVVDKPKR
ncbi:MAG: hypothetical protein KAW41_01230 [Candidatus Diapherotrites archaeon]|nr:hypothetical protein [Candidatus Diapherotrites archaeon]